MEGGEESRSGQWRRCITPAGAEASRGANGPQVPVELDCFRVRQLCSRFSLIMCLKSTLSACDTPAGKGDAGVSQRLWDLGRSRFPLDCLSVLSSFHCFYKPRLR